MMQEIRATSVALAGALCLLATSAGAATVYAGADPGSPIGGPTPNASAAEAAFKAAAGLYGKVVTEDFESQPLGFDPTLSIEGGSLTFVAANYGALYSGVTNSALGNIWGYNTTAGGEQWFSFIGIPQTSATFDFTNDTHAFGFWLTGFESATYSTAITVTQLDGAQSTFGVTLNNTGGAQFFGLVDATGFKSITIAQSGVANGGFFEAWGMDDVSYTTAVPEPATWALMIGGFGLVGGALRRRRTAMTA